MITNQNIELKNVVLHHNCSSLHDNELKYRTKECCSAPQLFMITNQNIELKNVVQHHNCS